MVTEINLGGLNINAGECWYPDPVDNLPSFLFITYLMHSKAQKLGSVPGSIEATHMPIGARSLLNYPALPHGSTLLRRD